jgi:excinuclease ABC subunit A
VIVIEHNLDVMKNADYIIDLGPGAGDRGGYVIAQGTPEEVVLKNGSATARYLSGVLEKDAGPALSQE